MSRFVLNHSEKMLICCECGSNKGLYEALDMEDQAELCIVCERCLNEKEVGVGDVFPLESFIEECKAGGFIDDDGDGYLSHDGKKYTESRSIRPSDLVRGNVNKKFNYVIWFNK